MSYADLKAKTALITGGAAGIGLAAAQRLAAEEVKLALVDVSAEALDEAKAELADAEVITIVADVTDEEQVAGFVARTVETYGGIDIFFNNAGIEGKVEPIVDTAVDDYRRVIEVNLIGAFLGLKHVLPIMYEQGSGSIINTSSVAGLGGSPNLAPYISSKHGLTGLTKTAALEAAPHGVRVNSVHPAPVHTRMMRSLEAGFAPDDPESAQAGFAATVPLGRYGEPIEIANLVAFLASDESSYITGAQYRIDGGRGA